MNEIRLGLILVIDVATGLWPVCAELFVIIEDGPQGRGYSAI